MTSRQVTQRRMIHAPAQASPDPLLDGVRAFRAAHPDVPVLDVHYADLAACHRAANTAFHRPFSSA